jgi:hypothetical protein
MLFVLDSDPAPARSFPETGTPSRAA